MSNLTIYPIFLLFMAILSLVSGIGALWTIRNQRAGWLTTFIWIVFAGSLATGFITFGLFTYVTGGSELIAFAVGGLGIAAVILVSGLAVM